MLGFMKIVSVSLSEKNISDLEKIRFELGLSNASETVRTALSDSIEKIQKEKSFAGSQNALLVVRHSHETERFVSKTKHAFQKLVKLQNHYCSEKNQCTDLFLLSGDAVLIKKMRNALLKNREIEKLVLVPL